MYPGNNYYCSDYFAKSSTYAFFTYLPCPFYVTKCGTDQKLNMTAASQDILSSALDQGDVCMYEITYPSANSNWKVWVTSMTNMEITIADGFTEHPYYY